MRKRNIGIIVDVLRIAILARVGYYIIFAVINEFKRRKA